MSRVKNDLKVCTTREYQHYSRCVYGLYANESYREVCIRTTTLLVNKDLGILLSDSLKFNDHTCTLYVRSYNQVLKANRMLELLRMSFYSPEHLIKHVFGSFWNMVAFIWSLGTMSLINSIEKMQKRFCPVVFPAIKQFRLLL